METGTQTYHIWLTVMLAAYEQGVVHGLVSKGYTVSAADADGSLTYTFKGAAASVIAVKVEKENIIPSELLEDVRSVLAAINAKYYSIVLCEHSHNCTWFGTNIVINKEAVKETKLVDKKTN